MKKANNRRSQDPPMSPSDLQIAQLAFREAEIQETIRFFKLLNDGHGDSLQNLKPDSPGSALAGFKDRLNMSAVTVAGHSYGATGALQALKGAPSEKMPINGAIMLDPGKGSGRLNKEIDLPILVFHSGEWTEKQTEFYGQGKHFGVVKKLVQSVKTGWFMTLSKSSRDSDESCSADLCSWDCTPLVYRCAINRTVDYETSDRHDTGSHSSVEGVYRCLG
jgi:platelet-activating factor acetylhydrolase